MTLRRGFRVAHLFLFAVFFALLPSSAYAEGLRISVAPIDWAVELKGGEVLTRSATFTNEGSEALNVHVTVHDFVPRGPGKNELVTLRQVGDVSMVPWVSLSEQEFLVPPKTQKSIVATLRVPNAPSPGQRYAVVLFTASLASANQQQVELAGRLGMKIYASAGEGNTRSAVLTSMLKADYPNSTPSQRVLISMSGLLSYTGGRLVPLVSEGRPLSVVVPIRNTGDIHITPNVLVEVRDIRGNRVSALTRDQDVILPQQSSVLGLFWKQSPLFGLYRVQVVVEYGTGQRLERGDTVLVFPWRLLLIMTLFIIGNWLLFSRPNVRAVRKASG